MKLDGLPTDWEEGGNVPDDGEAIIHTCWCGATGTYEQLFDESGLPERCGGSGVVQCECGGDGICVCHHHGECDCLGCEDCQDDDEDDDDYDYDEDDEDDGDNCLDLIWGTMWSERECDE